MKKHLLTLAFFLSLISFSKAQFAFIPDTNFRNFLMNNGFAGCMQGDSLDTTCTTVVSATKINTSGVAVHDLTGIKYFDNLDTLICGSNFLISLAELPSSLIYLDCGGNNITAITSLPPGLITLKCGYCQLSSLPSLPSSLITIDCRHNQLTGLPIIPIGLISLNCIDNHIDTLIMLSNYSLQNLYCSNNPHVKFYYGFPNSLVILECENDSLTVLPSLPTTLTILRCSYNQLTSLPALSPYLEILSCSHNNIISLPPFSNTLYSIDCSYNSIDSIPPMNVASDFDYLNCSYNQISTIPNINSLLNIHLDCNHNPLVYGFNYTSSAFNYFDCSNCGLFSLPWVTFSSGSTLKCDSNNLSALPPIYSVGELHCEYNLLTSLPNLDVYQLYCRNNLLVDLPIFYQTNIYQIDCRNNQITNIPDLPDSIGILRIDSNPITCLPEVGKIHDFYWSNTNIHCLPNWGHIYNATPSINNLHLCQLTDSCPSMWNMTGQVFFDADSNCVQDTSEISLKDIPVALDSGGVQLQEFLTDNFGRYSFRTGIGNYTVRIDTAAAPFRVVCPASFFNSSLLSPADSMDTIPAFGLLCNSGFDLLAKSISPDGMFRPGHQQALYLNGGEGMSFSGISCATSVSGSVEAIIQGLVTYISPAAGALTPTSINGDTITWNISDFSLIDPVHDFNIIVEVSSSATINDSVCVELNVLPTAGDNIPSNNSLSECFPIRNAVDPNEKYMSPSGLVDTSQQWFTFTIFFQNTGNAPAEDIYLLDTLDQNLDATTFTYLSSSHDVVTQLLPGNILRFNYPNIYLADSTTNEPLSHGYVQFKIKRKQNLAINTTISNTAYIYFDFNAAVVTNRVEATFVLGVGVSERQVIDFYLYPNPASSKLTIRLVESVLWRIGSRQYAIKSVEVYDVIGKVVIGKNFSVGKKEVTVDVSDLQQGIYFLKVQTETGSIVRKFVKQ